MKTFDIKYTDGRVITIKPVSWKQLEDVTILIKKLIDSLVAYNGSIGSLLTKKDVIDNLNKLANVIPVVGETSGINLDLIDDPWEIIKVFFTQTESVNEDGWISPEEGEGLKPSIISEINSLNFYSILAEVDKERKEK